MTKAAQRIMEALRAQPRECTHGESAIWDVSEAPRGLTVIMEDGAVYALPVSRGTAQALLHSWSIDAEG